MKSFFGKIDHNQHGKIGSSMPAWTMVTHIDNLQEEISAKKRQLERGEVPPDRMMQWKADIDKDEKRLSDILESKPNLTPEEEKEVEKAYNYLSGQISDTMFTRTEMKMGLADAREEARRISKACIKVNDKIADMAKLNNLKVVEHQDGAFISRRDAELLYKYCGHYINAATNSEWLRKDKATARTQPINPKYYEMAR